MARKVLLSFLGTGSMESKKEREYKTVNYHIEDKDLGDYPFVSAALKKYYDADKVILVGTVHSMWEEVYRWFSEENNIGLDEDAWAEIAEVCENANSTTDLVIPHQEKIEQAIGNGAKIVLIRYGINEREIKENIDIILGLQQYLEQQDELIVDVTHSFRSLPMFMMNLLIYLKNVCPKQIRISHIHYGMMEMIRELGHAPIIDLRHIMDVNDWITGAYSFSEFGNAYKIADLVADQDKSVSNMLNEFSDLMNLNHLHDIQNISQRLSSIKNKKYETLLPQLTINPIVNSFVNRFSIQGGTQALFQLKVAKWQLEHRKYAQAILTITEAIVTYVCEINNMQWNNKTEREKAKTVLLDYDSGDCAMLRCDSELSSEFNRLNSIRNSIAHSRETLKNVANMIGTLKECVTRFESIIKNSRQ